MSLGNILNSDNNNSFKISEYDIDNIYKKYLSQTNNEYESLIDEDPKKFYTVIKNSKIYENFTNTTRFKIFEKVCHMIKSIYQNEISLGLDILDLIIPYTDTSLLENTFTFSSINDTTFGLFLYSLEETKEIKIKTLKLISKYHKEIQAKNNFEYLLELINDEENEVRYEAINCLEELIPNIDILPYKTCEIIIFSLKEKNNKLRKLYMKLLSKMKLDIDQEKFMHILNLIKENIEAFPSDREKILKFMKNFTKNNIGCLNDDFFIKIFNLDQDFLIIEFDGQEEDNGYIIKMVVFDTYLVHKNYEINFKIPSFFIKHLYHYENIYPDIFEGNIYSQIQQKIFGVNNINKVEINEKNDEMEINEGKINKINGILINDNKNSINYFQLYNYIKYFILTNKLNTVCKEILQKLIIKLRLINLFLTNSSAKEKEYIFLKNISNTKQNNNYTQLINLNNNLLSIFDTLIIFPNLSIQKTIIDLINIDLNNILLSLSKEKTPLLNIDKLEEYQIYSNIKRGNKYFPFVLEFYIIIYHIHCLIEFKKAKEKNEIFIKNLFECYLILNSGDKKEKFEIDLFNPDCKISSSLEKNYICIKYKKALFLSNYKNPRDGINEFCFILEFKDKTKYKYNEIKKIIFNIDI